MSVPGEFGRRRPRRLRYAFGLLLLISLSVSSAAGAWPGPDGLAGGRGTPGPDAPGGIITNGFSTDPSIVHAFLFDPAVPIASLKTMPTWNELEQLLDNPYAIVPDSVTPGNDSGFPSYVATVTRRPSFGISLPPLVVHPLNYNPATGAELRLLNPRFPGGTFDNTSTCLTPAATTCTPPASSITVSAGSARVTRTTIDFNTPFARDAATCIELGQGPDAGQVLCGGDPGEPGYAGFGVLSSSSYSTPALPGSTIADASGSLLDPAGCSQRNAVSPGSCALPDGILRLLKPTLRRTPDGQPQYAVNAVDVLAGNPAALTPSTENDYFRGNNPAQKESARAAAAALGKALFWDMQVGSDGVQACASCHFKAGADDRTKNQVNPGRLAGDITFQLKQPNEELTAADFPLPKLLSPDIAGDPACTTPILANVSGVPGMVHPVAGNVTVCDAANKLSDTNDVVSSMGMHFGTFSDIITPGEGAFGEPSNPDFPTVRPLLPDLRTSNPAENVDPISGYAGTTGNELRRVEPRNSPTMLLSAVYFDNLWDGRARHDFNGGSEFGASDPQGHVFAQTAGGLVATRQLIRFSSLASLSLGPVLSDFEMSFGGRNWPKVGKRLLQSGVVPLANQLVDPTDSVLGPFSGQRSVVGGPVDRPGRPGLNVSYAQLIRQAFYPQLHANMSQHLNGAGDPSDPFDQYSLTIASGPAVATDTNQFTQMEANFSLFFGLAIQAWGELLVPDNTPFDQFLDANPDAFTAIGETGAAGVVADLPNCTGPTERNCFRAAGPFQRDTTFGGTRDPGTNTPDPLLGMDLFFGSNLSLKNPQFRSARCGDCHAMPALTNHTLPFIAGSQVPDFTEDFFVPGVNHPIDRVGRPRVTTGFVLESALSDNGRAAIERRMINQSIVPNPADGLAYPDGIFNRRGPDGIPGTPDDFTGAGSAFFDQGVYNTGVRPINEDPGRGTSDPFGLPLSLATLMLKNLGGIDYLPGVPLPNFDPEAAPECAPQCAGGGLLGNTPQDQQINPGLDAHPLNPLLPPHLHPWINLITTGNAHPDTGEAGGAPGGAPNTVTNAALVDGFVHTLGPFNPAGTLPATLNAAGGPLQGTASSPNRVSRLGSFKVPQLREVELTGPYFHNGGKLTLRQVVDFYARGGDFPITNSQHRSFNIVNLRLEFQSNLNEDEIVALVDFLLTLTDDRVRREQRPFDHPELFVPLDGTAPENGSLAGGVASGRQGFLNNLSNGMFRQLPAVGAAGSATPLQAFLGLSNERLVGADANSGSAACPVTGVTSQYCR